MILLLLTIKRCDDCWQLGWPLIIDSHSLSTSMKKINEWIPNQQFLIFF